MTPRKTATEISTLIITQLETSLSQSIPLLPKSFCRVLAKALGGVFVLLYQYAGWILLQMFVKTASNVEVVIGGVTMTPLKLWGSLVGIFQKAGQRAEMDVEITVITQGGSLTSGTRFVNPATEMIYTLVGDVDLDDAAVYGTIRATEIGDLGNVDVGTELNFVSPPSSVEKVVTVDSLGQSGVDEETTDDFRERVIERYAVRPQGGAYADYRDWAEEVVGVKNAYPYSGWMTPDDDSTRAGQVFVYIESTSDPDGIPDEIGPGGRPDDPPNDNLLQDVFENIEDDESGLANRRNINAYVKIYPISRVTVDVAVSALQAEDLAEVQAAIEDGLTDFFLDREPYITGLSIPPRKDIISESIIGGTVAQIAAAYGGYIGGVTIEVDSVQLETYILQEGEKAKIGTVTWP